MIYFTYKLTSYNTFLQELAKTLHAEMKEGILHLPEEIGDGFLRAIEFHETDSIIYAFKRTQENIIHLSTTNYYSLKIF
jgi:hypothetical protein